ncbi:hypothetical protein Patl1_25089 [Pistacia atlantica]|uniref:Uncharacterized protein n=1 Tax=Pistacia atlantica TaxID=434234 RepID=A0ACC1B2B1_9ROSI|nr:hypothetical protein Patl1_25089 [Pistacia atlantica]
MDFQTHEELHNILVGAHEHENLSFATAKEIERILGSFGYYRAPDGLDEEMAGFYQHSNVETAQQELGHLMDIAVPDNRFLDILPEHISVLLAEAGTLLQRPVRAVTLYAISYRIRNILKPLWFSLQT